MLSNYKEDSIYAIHKWLNEATRFKDNKIDIESYEDFIFYFKANVTYDIVADHIVMSYAGEKSYGIYCSGYADFCYQIKQSEMLEVQNRNTLDKLYNMVKNNNFGFIQSTLKLKDGNRFYYTSPCTSCNHGVTTCFSCGGRGRDSCNFCAGLGNISKTREARGFDGSSYMESYMERCVHCHGRGYNECSRCGGRGEVTCDICGGSGVKTEVASISVYARARYGVEFFESEMPDDDVKSAIEKMPLFKLARFGDIELLEQSTEHSVFECYKACVPFAKIASEFHDEKITWILYGRTHEISDAGGILDLLLAGDMIELEEKANLAYLKPFISISSKNTIINFMKSSINVTLFEKDTLFGNQNKQVALNDFKEWIPRVNFKAMSLQERSERDCALIGNAISMDSVRVSLFSMYKLLKWICFYSQIKWFLFSFLVVFCFMVYDKSRNFMHAKNNGNLSKIYTYKKDNVTYLNKSYLNINKDSKDSKNDNILKKWLDKFSVAIYIDNVWKSLMYGLIIFIPGGLLAYYYRKLWFKFKAKPLHLWMDRYDINRKRYFRFWFIGIALLGFVFYFFPIFVTDSGYIYGFLPLEFIGWFSGRN